jgi:hypothetical protein
MAAFLVELVVDFFLGLVVDTIVGLCSWLRPRKIPAEAERDMGCRPGASQTSRKTNNAAGLK